MTILDKITESPIIKDGEVIVSLSDETIVELCIGLFIALALAIMVYFFLGNVVKK